MKKQFISEVTKYSLRRKHDDLVRKAQVLLVGVLGKCGLMLKSVHDKQLKQLVDTHKRQQNNLRRENECNYRQAITYIENNHRIRIHQHRYNECECRQMGFTVYFDEFLFCGMRPGDSVQEEFMQRVLSMHIADMIRRGRYEREG